MSTPEHSSPPTLRLETSNFTFTDDVIQDDQSPLGSNDSLFDEVPASRTAPPIPGLFYEPSWPQLPQELATEVVRFCVDTYFTRPNVNQIMLFGRHGAPGEEAPSPSIPKPLLGLLASVSEILRPYLPQQTYDLLFPSTPSMARQVILNLYEPGEGISPHIDLLGRYGDGIIGIALQGTCAMQFTRGKQEYGLFLPERRVLVLSGEARYEWAHGIERKREDLVESDDGPKWIERSVRLSVTFRWLLPGGDVVGSE